MEISLDKLNVLNLIKYLVMAIKYLIEIYNKNKCSKYIFGHILGNVFSEQGSFSRVAQTCHI